MRRSPTFDLLFALALVCMTPSLRAQPPARSDLPSAPIDSGFLFINGQYVQPPYEFESDDDRLTINGIGVQHQVSVDAGDHFERTVGVRRRGGPRFGWRGGAFSFPTHRYGLQISESLQLNSVVVLNANEIEVFTETGNALQFLQLLGAAPESRSDSTIRSLSRRKETQKWLSTFVATEGLQQRLQTEVARLDAQFREGVEFGRAVNRLDESVYPMAVIGMMLVAIAFAHLLGCRSSMLSVCNEISNASNGAVTRSLILVAALSVLDLVWTLLMHQAGVMTETNPIAARFIHDPIALATFKITITGIGVGLLFFLRRHLIARRAAWCICLVCTLLTIRWLSVNSLLLV